MPLFKPTESEFAEQIVRTLAGRNVPSKYEPEAGRILTQNGLNIYLGNFYRDYCAAPFWRRGKVIDHYLSILDQTSTAEPETPEQARVCLMPKVRERAYTELANLRVRQEGKPTLEIQQRIFGGGHLTLEVVYDTPRFTRSITPKSLEEWGLTFDDALGIANENLKRRSGGGGFEVVRPGLFRSTWRDTFDASRMHLPDFVTPLPVKGRHVAMVPNRDVLLITGEGDAECLAAMAKVAEGVLNEPRPMNGLAFRLDAGWVPFLPPVDHPAYKGLKTLQVKSMAGDYATQKSLLDAQFAKEQTDLFVASVMAYNDKAGIPFSMASWAENVDGLLPRTDYIGFSGTGADGKPGMLGIADWEDAERVAPELLEAQGMYPERYRTRGFPTQTQLDAIGLRSTPR